MALEALGYKVTRDCLIAGTQVDLYCELKGDLFVHRQVVECKSSGSEISVSDVRQLAALANAISTESEPISGLVVSASGFTKTARQFAEKAGIKLLQLKDLASLSFDPSLIVSHTIEWFENDELGRSYVNLSCQVREIAGGTIYRPVEKFLDDFFHTTKRPGVALLGNFGTGKTSLCKHYAYLLARRWDKGEAQENLPIYMNLRDCHSFLRIEDEILTSLTSNYSLRITSRGLRQWLSNGSTLLFLDGFDEMAAKLDRVTIAENLDVLGRFCESNSVKIVLSCRTHFFKTQVEESALKGMLRLYMCDWGPTELTDYVNKSMPDKAESSLLIIHNTYNLEELAKTPIFLNMITATISELGGSVNQAKLYQLYTDRWIQHQDYRSKISPPQKRKFMEELAFEMFESKRPRIDYQHLPSRIKHIFDLRDYESVASFDRDIRTCSFLVRDDEGFYYFSHKSFMEFFVGLRLAQLVKEGDTNNFNNTELTFEVAGFLADYFESDWTQLIRLLIGGPTTICRANSALTLGCLKPNEKIRSALVLSLETETDPKVQRRVVDALASLGGDDSVRAIASYAISSGDLGAYCLKGLAVFQDHTIVEEIYSSTLKDSTDTDRLCIVLNSVASHRALKFREHISPLIHKNLHRHDEDLTLALLHAIEAIANLDLALQCEKFVDTEAPITIHRGYALQVKDELCKRARLDIEDTARRNKGFGLTHSKNASNLRQTFRYLATEEHVRETLSTLYPELRRHKLKRRK